MEFFFGVFDNDESGSLRALTEEEEEINAVLREKMDSLPEGGLDKEKKRNQKFDDFVKDLSSFSDRMTIFHFSGHHGNGQTYKSDLRVDDDKLIAILNSCKKLKIVFLNGCETITMGRKLDNVPVVISTTKPVLDNVAKKVAIKFYKNLCKGDRLTAFGDEVAIKKSYKKALKFTDLSEEKISISENNERGERAIQTKKLEIATYYDISINVDAHSFEDKMIGQRVMDENTAHDTYKKLIKEWFKQQKKDRVYLKERTKNKDKYFSYFPKPIAHFLKIVDPEQKYLGYQKLGNLRFGILQCCFNSCLTFFKFCSFSVIWEEVKAGRTKLSEGQKAKIIAELEDDWCDIKDDDESLNRRIDFLINFNQLLITNNCQNAFIKELSAFLKKNTTQLKLFSKLFSVDAEEAKQEHFIQGEDWLSFFVEQVSFLKNYEFVSVLDPTYTRFRFEGDKFVYKVRYYSKGRNKELIETHDATSQIYDVFSILLKDKRLEKKAPAVLNLSPFYIDENQGEHGVDNIELTGLGNCIDVGDGDEIFCYYNYKEREMESKIFSRTIIQNGKKEYKYLRKRKVVDHIKNFVETIIQS